MTLQQIQALPKVLLHTHLEGSVPINTLVKLGKKNKISIPTDFPDILLHEITHARNWNTFRSYFKQICSCFVTYRDFRDVVFDYSSELAAQNVKYAEFHISPWKHLSRGIDLDVIAKGLLSGIELANQHHCIKIKIICDFVRNNDEETSKIFDWFTSLPSKDFVAIGISGGTGALPRKNYIQYCERAKELGYSVIAHAGEFEGPESVEFVIDHCLVDRIAHGIRIVESPILLNSKKVQNIHFDVCPTSTQVRNIGLPKFGSIREMLMAKLKLTINTDDELFFKTTISRELLLLLNKNIIDEKNILDLQKNALDSAFIANPVEKLEVERLFR